jgi:hypothetical protein
MDALTLAEIPEHCPFWPCKLNAIASIIIVLAAIKYVIQFLLQYARKSKTGG